ncbi:HEPN domain-containing protein [Staphylococcus saprophyticus]
MVEEVNNLKNLFSFLMDMRILVEELFLKNNEEQFKVLWSNESGIRVSKKRASLIAEAKDLIQNSLPTIITNYYKTDIFQDIFETYVNNMYKTIYVEDFLLSQITLIEGLDTRFRDKKQTNLKTRLEKFFENFCEDEIEKINNQLGSEIQLNQELVNYLREFRNYHSHLYELERKPETQLDMYTISIFLRELIKIYMLSKLTK